MDSCFMVDWLRCLTSCELWLKFLPIYRTFLRSFPQVLVNPLCDTNVTPHIIALSVLQITIDLSVRIARRRFHLFLTKYFHESCRNIIAFQTTKSDCTETHSKVARGTCRNTCMHKYTWHCYLHFFLNNCALFLLNHLLLSSSCFSFHPQHDFRLQIIVLLSTRICSQMKTLMHSVFFLIWWTSWVTSLS